MKEIIILIVVIITKWMGVYQRQLKPLSHLLLILFVETVKKN